MLCPNCGKEMKYSYREWEEWTLAHWDCDHGDYKYEEKYNCPSCRIKNVNNEWIVPKKYLPTEKQIKTILFINNHLQMHLEAITKHQCWIDIGKYFKEAQETPLPEYEDDEYCQDLQDYFGYTEADFY
jgi:reverse gyrase